MSFIDRNKQVEKILGVLEKLNKWVDEIPPTDQPTRFGNKAFRTFYTKVEQVCNFIIIINLNHIRNLNHL